MTRLVFTFLTLCASAIASAQTLPPPKVESPNAGTLDNFTGIPVDMFTGVPNISIPIHTLSYGKVNVPILLRYHPGLLREAAQAGWVGQGWDLESTGTITRQVRDYPDEACIPELANGGLNGFVPYYPSCVTPQVTSGSELVNVSNWADSSRLGSYYTLGGYNPSGIMDAQADEFTFDVMGHSGKFYYGGPTLGWQVVSNENITIQQSGFLTGTDMVGAINQYQEFIDESFTDIYSSPTQSRMFSTFILTVPDGTKFYFGGINAVELTSAYGINNAGISVVAFSVNTWYLTKIADANNHEVDFTYKRKYPTVNLGFGASNYFFSAGMNNGGLLGRCGLQESFQFSTIMAQTHNGQYIWGTYLNTISDSNETVTFNSGSSFSSGNPTALNYSATVLTYNDGVPGSINKNDLSYLNPNGSPTVNPLMYLQWQQLNSIVVKNSALATYRQFNFSYSNSPTQRLTLNSFNESDANNALIENYAFTYNNISSLPAPDGNFTDSWGFYNGKDETNVLVDQLVSGLYKATDPAKVTTGILTKIVYPTGGYALLQWAAHDYSAVVSADRQSLTSATGLAGGCRITNISIFAPDGTPAVQKSYYYVKGYNSTVTNPASLPSSGVLNGTPLYTFNFTNRETFNHTAAISFYFEAINSTTSYSYAGSGSYIGYDEVVEVNADGSYARHLFTNYGPDYNGVAHYDILPAGHIGWVPGQTTDTYCPMSSLELERGKPIADIEYSNHDALVRKTVTTYRNDPARFNTFIKLTDFNGNFACGASTSLIFASARCAFPYEYYPVGKTVTTYDIHGLQPVTSSLTYTYNSNNLVSSESTINSQGQMEAATYKYPTDFTDATSTAMVAAHILDPIIESVTLTNNSPQKLTHTNYFSPSAGLYVPQSTNIQILNNPIETREQYYQYDRLGNPEEMSKSNDIHIVYLWSYHAQHLVAKIEGSTYSAVSAHVTQAQIDAATSSDASLRTLMAGLRAALPGALVTSYTYLPAIGITSETDPEGRTTFYVYDTFQRLKLIQDFHSNIVKTFNYQYQN